MSTGVPEGQMTLSLRRLALLPQPESAALASSCRAESTIGTLDSLEGALGDTVMAVAHAFAGAVSQI